MISVPDGREHRVGEPQIEELFETELAEEMVDAEDLLFPHRSVQVRGQRPRGGEIVAERLLDQDPRVAGQSSVSYAVDDHGEQ